MRNKEKYIYLEILFTFFLLLLVLFLLEEAVFSYWQYVILGLICGFIFSWFNRNKSSSSIRFFMNAGALATFIWIIYSIFNSSFLYKEVILIYIKGALILEIILSFNAYASQHLVIMQAVSVPLFMSFPLVARCYDAVSIISILGYFIFWFAILKLKFYGLLKSEQQRSFRKHSSIFLSILFFLIVLFVSWVLFSNFSNFSFEKIREGGFLKEEGAGTQMDLGSLEKEYYGFQDRIQEEITNLIPEFESIQDKYELIALLGDLIKEPNYVMEIDKAQQGLISYLKTPGLGLEKRESGGIVFLINNINNYLDKKIKLSLKRNKDNILNNFKGSVFNIKDRISVSSRADKIQHSNSYQQICRYERELKEIIDNNSSLGIDAKEELREFTGRLKEWKTFEIYRKKINYLEKEIESSTEQVRQEFLSLISDIKRTENLEDFKEIADKIEESEKKNRLQPDNLTRLIEEILNLKLDMLIFEKNREIRDRISSYNLSLRESRELQNSLNNAIEAADNYQEFLQDFLKVKEKIQEDDTGTSQEMEDLLGTKIYFFVKEKKQKIEDALTGNIPSDLKEKFLDDLEKLELDRDADRLDIDIEKIKEDIEQLLNQGFIYEQTRDNLIKEIDDFKNLLMFQMGVDKESKQEISSKDKGQLDYQREPREVIKEPSSYPKFQTKGSVLIETMTEKTKLVSIILSPQNSKISMLDTLEIKAEGYFSDSSRKDITSLVTWNISGPNIIKIEKNIVRPIMIGNANLYAEYSGIKSLPADIKIIITAGWLIQMILKGIFVLILSVVMLSSILYYITERKKKKLFSLYKNPKEFIIGLYENIKGTLSIFNLRYKESVAPLSYAGLIERKLSIKNNLFLRFTEKFEEAKYSHHVLQSSDASLALSDYNNFLKILFSQQSKIDLFFKYCLALIHKIPLFIGK